MFINPDQWLFDVERRARQTGDEQRLYMLRLYRNCWGLFEIDPEQALTRLAQARDLAITFQDDCCRIIFEHWMVQVYLYYQVDVAKALDLAARSAAEIRRFPGCPVHASAVRGLIDAYMEYDPVGYTNEIREALAYLENAVALDQDTWQAIPDQHADLLVALERLPEALDQELRSLDRSQGSDFRIMYACRSLAEICFGLGRPDEVLNYAALGEGHARRSSNSGRVLAALILWQAYCHCHLGDSATAAGLYQRAMNTITRQKASLVDRYFDPLCAYLEADGALDAAIRARTLELDNAVQGHSPYRESLAHLKRCRLLEQAGTLTAAELGSARAVSARLKNPTRYLARLDRIAAGDTAPTG